MNSSGKNMILNENFQRWNELLDNFLFQTPLWLKSQICQV